MVAFQSRATECKTETSFEGAGGVAFGGFQSRADQVTRLKLRQIGLQLDIVAPNFSRARDRVQD